MSKGSVLILLALICVNDIYGLTIIRRDEWGAKTPKDIQYSNNNLQYVIIHHSAGAWCAALVTCKHQMVHYQDYHMNRLGYPDIGYNFGIGGDGRVYEGRGFGVVGTHAVNWDSKSLGIMFFGNYNNNKPNAVQIQAAKELINSAVSKGFVRSAHIIKGHRQVGNTDCPGNNLYAEIKKWPKWQP